MYMLTVCSMYITAPSSLRATVAIKLHGLLDVLCNPRRERENDLTLSHQLLLILTVDACQHRHALPNSDLDSNRGLFNSCTHSFHDHGELHRYLITWDFVTDPIIAA
jgi:hypothetical protein